MERMDSKTQTSVSPSIGRTTVSPGVLLTVARLTTLRVSGVSRLCSSPGSVNRFFGWESKKPPQLNEEGVRIEVKDDLVYADLYVILQPDVNIRDVSRNIQREVARAFSKTVGMQIGRINIHIEDIDYSYQAEA